MINIKVLVWKPSVNRQTKAVRNVLEAIKKKSLESDFRVGIIIEMSDVVICMNM